MHSLVSSCARAANSLTGLPLREGEMGEAQRGSEWKAGEMGEAQRGSALPPARKSDC